MKKWIVIFFTIAALVGLRASDTYVTETVRLKTFDYLISQLPAKQEFGIVLVDIDDDSLQQQGQWPWPREDFCSMLKGQVTGLTVLFPEKDRYETDAQLANCMLGSPTVIAAAGSNSVYSGKPPHVGTAAIGEDPKPFLFEYQGVLNNVPELEAAAKGNGITSTAPELDGLVRRVPLIFNIADVLYPSFGLDMLRTLAGSPSYSLKTTETGVSAIRVRNFPVIETDPNARIWVSWNTQFRRMSATEFMELETKPMVAIIGVTAKGASTLIATADGLKAPHEVQASILATLINGTNISRPDWANGAEIIALAVVLILLAILSSNLIFSIPALITAVFGAGILSRHFFLSDGLLLDPSFIIFGACTLWAVSNFMNFLIQFKMRQQIKKQFEHYLDPRMVRKLQKDPGLLKLGGDRRDMTFLFSDIRGFTPISEKFKEHPEGLVELINKFLTNQTDIILKHGGTVDKYMGDCIMAFWNAPLDDPNHAENAIRAAIEMREELDTLNAELKKDGIEILTGIGINSGPCIVGNMGSTTRFDYSVIGDAVNLASRLEGQCKDFETDLIISENTRKLAPNFSYGKLGSVTVKGKTEAVTIYTTPKIGLDNSSDFYYNT